jgi:hypothetical protein
MKDEWNNTSHIAGMLTGSQKTNSSGSFQQLKCQGAGFRKRNPGYFHFQ